MQSDLPAVGLSKSQDRVGTETTRTAEVKIPTGGEAKQ
jgi:hypothetical protein